MSPAASASQYLWSIPSHGLRDFELPPTGKENEVRVGPRGVNKDTASSQKQGSELQPFQTHSHLSAVPTSGPSPLLHILSLPPAARVPLLPVTHPSHSPLNHPSGPVPNCFPAGQASASCSSTSAQTLPSHASRISLRCRAGAPSRVSLLLVSAGPAPPTPCSSGPYSRSHARDPAIIRQALSRRPSLSLQGRKSLISTRGENFFISLSLFLPCALMLAGTRASSSEPSQKPLARIGSAGTARSEAPAFPNIKSRGESSPTFLGTGLPRRFNSSSNCRARWKRNGDNRGCAGGCGALRAPRPAQCSQLQLLTAAGQEGLGGRAPLCCPAAF